MPAARLLCAAERLGPGTLRRDRLPRRRRRWSRRYRRATRWWRRRPAGRGSGRPPPHGAQACGSLTPIPVSRRRLATLQGRSAFLLAGGRRLCFLHVAVSDRALAPLRIGPLVADLDAYAVGLAAVGQAMPLELRPTVIGSADLGQLQAAVAAPVGIERLDRRQGRPNVRVGRLLVRPILEAQIGRHRDRQQDPDDHDHHQQLDQRERVLAPDPRDCLHLVVTHLSCDTSCLRGLYRRRAASPTETSMTLFGRGGRPRPRQATWTPVATAPA